MATIYAPIGRFSGHSVEDVGNFAQHAANLISDVIKPGAPSPIMEVRAAMMLDIYRMLACLARGEPL